MSKHRAADDSLTLTPLAARLAELTAQAAAQDANDPRFRAIHDSVGEVADVVRRAVTELGRQQKQLDARYETLLTQLEAQSARAETEVAVADAARIALEGGAELLVEVRAMRHELAGSAGLLTGAQAVLEAGVRRMQTSGDALVRYLDDRDLALEAERDRVLRDVLEDFAASLHARERRTLAKRLVDAVDRRRDARDAARWRDEHAADQRPTRPQAVQSAGAGPRVIDLDAAVKRRSAPRP